jgi:hypothetical protein
MRNIIPIFINYKDSRKTALSRAGRQPFNQRMKVNITSMGVVRNETGQIEETQGSSLTVPLKIHSLNLLRRKQETIPDHGTFCKKAKMKSSRSQENTDKLYQTKGDQKLTTHGDMILDRILLFQGTVRG